MKKLKISASFLCLCVVIILTSLAFFYQKGNTTDGTVGSDSPDKENTLKPSASKGSDEFVNDADASEHSQSSHAEIDYSTYESTTLGISISYPAALQDIMANSVLSFMLIFFIYLLFSLFPFPSPLFGTSLSGKIKASTLCTFFSFITTITIFAVLIVILHLAAIKNVKKLLSR